MTHATERLLEDVKTVATDVQEQVREATERSSAKVAGTLGKLRAPLERMQGRLSEKAEAAVETVRATARATDEYVHKTPWPVIGAAVVVALGIGFLLGRR
jgi:ElaB/YqjD/DUF883 family membrane-anchored ribosome-binding protein